MVPTWLEARVLGPCAASGEEAVLLSCPSATYRHVHCRSHHRGIQALLAYPSQDRHRAQRRCAFGQAWPDGPETGASPAGAPQPRRDEWRRLPSRDGPERGAVSAPSWARRAALSRRASGAVVQGVQGGRMWAAVCARPPSTVLAAPPPCSSGGGSDSGSRPPGSRGRCASRPLLGSPAPIRRLGGCAKESGERGNAVRVWPGSSIVPVPRSHAPFVGGGGGAAAARSRCPS